MCRDHSTSPLVEMRVTCPIRLLYVKERTFEKVTSGFQSKFLASSDSDKMSTLRPPRASASNLSRSSFHAKRNIRSRVNVLPFSFTSTMFMILKLTPTLTGPLPHIGGSCLRYGPSGLYLRRLDQISLLGGKWPSELPSGEPSSGSISPAFEVVVLVLLSSRIWAAPAPTTTAARVNARRKVTLGMAHSPEENTAGCLGRRCRA